MRIFWLILLLGLPGQSFATINFVGSTTDIAWAAKQIGGKHVSVKSFLKGHEDPHYVDAMPNFALMAAGADIVCAIGLDLELGWLPRVLARSANSAVQAGGKGYCELGNGIKPRDIPAGKIDRSMGHVHAKGNPHFWLAPVVFAEAAIEIKKALQAVDPNNSQDYETGYQQFVTRMRNLQTELGKLTQGRPLKVMEYHEEFAYFLDALGIQSYGALEAKPGLPPSAARIASVAVKTQQDGVQVILATTQTPKNVLAKLSELNPKINVIVSQISLPTPEADYEAMLRELTRKLLATQSISKEHIKANDLHKG